MAFSIALPSGYSVPSASFMPALAKPATPVPTHPLSPGWNLIATGDNPTPAQFDAAIASATTTPPTPGQVDTNLTSLWAWDANSTRWYFWAPSLANTGELKNYLESKGYVDFATGPTLSPTSGLWVNVPKPAVSGPALGASWTTRVNGFGATNGYLHEITWGAHGYVAVGSDQQGDTVILTSTDGVQWVQRDTGSARFSLGTVTWSGSEYIAGGLETVRVGSSGGATYSPNFLVSADGETWSRREAKWDGQSVETGDVDDSISSIVASGKSLVAIRHGVIYSSQDGVAWTSRGRAGASRAVWNNGQFLIASNGNGYSGILTSPDGISWNSRMTIQNTDGTNALSIADATWSGSSYVVVGQEGVMGSPTWGLLLNSTTATSWNGTIWQSGVFTNLTRVIWDGRQFVAVGSRVNNFGVNATVDAVLTSSDGSHWREAYRGTVFHSLKSIAASPMGYAAVGADGAIITSP